MLGVSKTTRPEPDLVRRDDALGRNLRQKASQNSSPESCPSSARRAVRQNCTSKPVGKTVVASEKDNPGLIKSKTILHLFMYKISSRKNRSAKTMFADGILTAFIFPERSA